MSSHETELDPATDDATNPEAVKMELDVQIAQKSACERHVTVTIPRTDIERYFDRAYSELMPKASVPGFRAGRAPRKLVEQKFRKEIADQVKGSLLMDTLAQVSEDQKLTPISEPDFDPTAVKVPDDGPMTFEFDIEVRPEFDLPEWRGLSIERPTRAFSSSDVDVELRQLLERKGSLEPFDGPAGNHDFIVANITFLNGDQLVTKLDEQTIRIRKELSFKDGKVEGFDKLAIGAKAGDTLVGEALLSLDAPNEELRGKAIRAEFAVLEVKKLQVPALTDEFLDELGFDSEGDLRDAILENLERRLKYEQQQRVREQVLASLTVAADWDLPPAMLKRQSQRELQRAVLELQRSGFSDEDIRNHANELSRNSQASTAKALKEHFILERIAEQEKIEDLPEDYDHEIELIAEQSDESPRRVRAQLEKRGLMDTLRNQIIERKVIDLILAEAVFKDVAYKAAGQTSEALDEAAGGEQSEAVPAE